MARTVRIKPGTHTKLKELAELAGASMPEILERAVEAYQRQQFLKGLAEDYAKLRSDPKAWAGELAERKAWDATLVDGLEDEPDERPRKRRGVVRRSQSRSRT